MHYKIKLRRKGSYFIAILKARIGKDASITVRAKVAVQAIARVLKETYSGRVGAIDSNLMSSIWQSATSIAKKAAQQKVLKSAYKLLRQPDLTKISKIISAQILYPAIQAIETTLKAAKYFRIIDKSPDSRSAMIARSRIKQALQVAKDLQGKGDPKGTTLARALKAGKKISIPKITISQPIRLPS